MTICNECVSATYGNEEHYNTSHVYNKKRHVRTNSTTQNDNANPRTTVNAPMAFFLAGDEVATAMNAVRLPPALADLVFMATWE